MKARGFTIEELARRGLENLPEELISYKHLIYSSPATLAFNSPGAEGFGVKRAGLAVPESVMLIVAPGCCGRNTSLISRIPGYENRFFYLNMDETDIVTGRHLKLIPKAAREVYDFLPKKPAAFMICITCVDALLGTDMERVCRKVETEIPIPVRPCYMYALTREGRKPPMVHVRQSIYSLLEQGKKKGTVANLLGFFSPLMAECELYELLKKAGIRQIYEIGNCPDFKTFKQMSTANFNLVLHPEARAAAKDFADRLQIPGIELTRVYRPDKIHNQYRALGMALGAPMDDTADLLAAQKAMEIFAAKHKGLSVSVGECLNADPFEMGLFLTQMGLKVPEIFGTVTTENIAWLKALAKQSPETMVYSNMEPTMVLYDPDAVRVDLTLGKDAGYYHQEAPGLAWNTDIQPFGYAGTQAILREMDELLG